MERYGQFMWATVLQGTVTDPKVKNHSGTSFFPTCQVMVSRFYKSCIPPQPPPPPPRRPLWAPNLNGECRTSTASSRSQWALRDLNGINVRIDALRCHGGDHSKQSNLEKSLGLLKAAKVFLYSCGYTVVLPFTALEAFLQGGLQAAREQDIHPKLKSPNSQLSFCQGENC